MSAFDGWTDKQTDVNSRIYSPTGEAIIHRQIDRGREADVRRGKQRHIMLLGTDILFLRTPLYRDIETEALTETGRDRERK